MAKYHLQLAHFYGDLMNTYGDIGNITALKYYAKQMDTDIHAEVISMGDAFAADNFDLSLFGGGQDYEQMVISKDIQDKKEQMIEYIEDNKPFLAICGGYQLLGHYYIGADGERIPGIGALDHYTLSQDHHRFIGNIVIENQKLGKLHGFENHNGRTFLGKSEKPLGIVLSGHGNNGEDKTEGAIYKSTYCSYFHGPILTRNGEIAKEMLLTALHNKYPEDDFSQQAALEIKPTF